MYTIAVTVTIVLGEKHFLFLRSRVKCEVSQTTGEMANKVKVGHNLIRINSSYTFLDNIIAFRQIKQK